MIAGTDWQLNNQSLDFTSLVKMQNRAYGASAYRAATIHGRKCLHMWHRSANARMVLEPHQHAAEVDRLHICRTCLTRRQQAQRSQCRCRCRQRRRHGPTRHRCHRAPLSAATLHAWRSDWQHAGTASVCTLPHSQRFAAFTGGPQFSGPALSTFGPAFSGPAFSTPPLTLKAVSESRVTWATSVPILVSLGLSVLDLRPMCATDVRQTDVRQKHCLMPPSYGAEA